VYLPPFFREDRVDVLHALVRAHPLAALITLDSDGIVANHIPLLVDAEPAPLGRLVGHVARANPVWRDFSAEVPSLAIFSGPEHYISPSWYPSKAEDGRVVPTWNYAAVHVYGRLEIREDPEWLRALVTRLTATHEAQFEQPWAVTDAPLDYVDGLLKAIVGIEMRIERIEGKWKMGQNRSAEDRRGAVAGLMKGRSETCPTD
jgi:transcriptional regulator